MIQRIQSVYLLLSGISMLLILLTPFGFQASDSGVVVVAEMMDNIPTLSLCIASAVIALISIFLYNNRRVQIRVTIFLMVIILCTAGSVAFYQFYTEADTLTNPGFLPYVLAGFALIFAFLAYKGISADEKLVRSMDRLR